MPFIIKAKSFNDKEVADSLLKDKKVFFGKLREWMKNERANMLGGKDAKRKIRKGYRNILQNKKLRKRGDKWSARITNLFKGHIPFAKNIKDLKLTMGILGTSKHQLQRALEMLQTGGTIPSRSQMPIPVYKNLARIGFTGPWSMGSVKSGLKSKAFRIIARRHGLVGIKKGGKVFYFDPRSRKANQRGFERSGLMFLGLFGVRVKRQLKGRFDFYARWDRIYPKAIKRGQTAIDRAVKAINRRKTKK